MHFPHFCKFYLTLFLLFAAAIFFPGACSSKKVARPKPADQLRIKESPATVNLNSADAEQLQRIPNVGPRLAEKIVEHRDRFGPFRKIEHLLIIDGVSEKRFHAMRHFVTIN